MTDHKATRKNWASPLHGDPVASILELRARVEALEGKYETMRLATLEWGKCVENLQRWSDQHLRQIEELEADRWLRQHAKPKQANSRPTPNPSQIRSSIQLTPEQEEAIAALLRPDHFGQVNKMVAGSLVERLAKSIRSLPSNTGISDWSPEARAAIREVATAAREQRGRLQAPMSWEHVAQWLEQGLDRWDRHPLVPAENTMTDEEFAALILQSDHAPGDAEIATSQED